MKGQCAAALLVVASFIGACSAGAPLVLVTPDPVQSEEKVIRGVVNGIWQFDPKQNADRLASYSIGASEAEAAPFSERYQVRVGISRSMLVTRFVEVVPLPEGWTHSMDKIVNNARTINVGDVVDIQTVVGSRIIPLIRIVRKCDEPPLADEDADWNIGCKSYDSFRSNGYAGEVYVLTGF